MLIATWWTSDPLPALPPLAGLRTRLAYTTDEIAVATRLAPAEVDARRAAGHRAYIAHHGGSPVLAAWIATRRLRLSDLDGRLDGEIEIPSGSCILWGFRSAPGPAVAEERKDGWDVLPTDAAPYLLQSIARHEHAERFWLVAAGDLPACAAILAAGFQPAGDLEREQGAPLLLRGAEPRSREATALFGALPA